MMGRGARRGEAHSTERGGDRGPGTEGTGRVELSLLLLKALHEPHVPRRPGSALLEVHSKSSVQDPHVDSRPKT